MFNAVRDGAYVVNTRLLRTSAGAVRLIVSERQVGPDRQVRPGAIIGAGVWLWPVQGELGDHASALRWRFQWPEMSEVS